MDFGLSDSARTHEKQRKGSIQRSASVRGVGSNAQASVNVNRVNVNGRSYVGSDSPRAAASALGSSYSIPPHGVSRNGMCMCMYVCMHACMCVWRQSPGPGALPWGKCGLARAWAVRGNVHVTLVGREASTCAAEGPPLRAAEFIPRGINSLSPRSRRPSSHPRHRPSSRPCPCRRPGGRSCPLAASLLGGLQRRGRPSRPRSCPFV